MDVRRAMNGQSAGAAQVAHSPPRPSDRTLARRMCGVASILSRVDSSRSAATAEHLFEGAQRAQQIRADGAVVAGHGEPAGRPHERRQRFAAIR